MRVRHLAAQVTVLTEIDGLNILIRLAEEGAEIRAREDALLEV